MKKIYSIAVLSIVFSLVACKKDYLETSPTDRVDRETLFQTVQGAQVAMDGIYKMLYTSGWATNNLHQNFGIMSTKLYTSLMGEDMVQDAQGNGWFYFDYRYDVRSRYTATTWRPYSTWNFYYQLISNANLILASEENMSGEPEEIGIVMAQAYAMRAYAYFQLIQSFQQTYVGHESSPGVPLYTEPTSSASEGKGRGTVEDVYRQINEDLDEAIRLFNANQNEAGQRIDVQAHKSHIDYYVANAFKANVAMVQNRWTVAIDAAEEALSKPSLRMATAEEIHGGFNDRNMPGVMWGAEVIADQSGIYASFFSHMDARASRYAASSRKCIYNWLYDQIPASDSRKEWWNGPTDGGTAVTKPYNQYKFQYSDLASDLGDYIFLRAEEMQLVLAEALANADRLPEAKDALAALMSRRNPNYQAILDNVVMSKELRMGSIGTPTTLMDQIILQRRIELWGEAERIFDILRLKTGFSRNAPGTNHSALLTWDTLDPDNKEFILTIPQKEFDGNPNMDANTDQNPM